MLIKRTLLLIFLTFSGLQIANARWGVESDAPITVKSYKRDIYVNKDGTAKTTIEVVIKINNEVGRDKYSNYVTSYNADNSKFKVIEAKTINASQEFVVEKSAIEDKSLASDSMAFDDVHQVIIAFTNADIGSLLYLKYEDELISPPLANFFETTFAYGFDGYSEKSSVTVTSEIPFYIDINDPNGVLDVKQSSSEGLANLEIELIKPIFSQLFNEQKAQIDPKQLTVVHLSTIRSWKEYALRMHDDYKKVLAEPLPNLYREILEKAKLGKSLTEKIDIVTSELANKIRYMGDWRSTSGRFIPRPLKEVEKSQYGDCKDLSAATTVILRAMGIKTNLALVTRGPWVYDNPSRLAGFSAFNHMIVHVQDGDKILWIDPTNIVSTAGSLFFDISDRRSLVITSDDNNMQFIPSIKPEENISEIVKTIDLSKIDSYNVTGELFYRNIAAQPITGAELFTSIENIRYFIFSQLGDTTKMSNKALDMPELKSRIVEDLHFSYSYDERSSEIMTNAGKGIILSIYNLGSYIYDQNRVSDIFQGEPQMIKSKKLFTNIKAVDKKLTSIEIDYPWLSVRRKIRYGKNYISVDDVVIIKKSIVTNKEMHSEEYQEMVKKLESYFSNGTAIIFERAA